jgi:hypothetical protein
MQQRVAIGHALIRDPELILMDELFGALDALTRERTNLEMARIWRESKKTIIFVTHNIVFRGTHCAVLTARPAPHSGFRSIFPIRERLTSRRRKPLAGSPSTSMFCWAWRKNRANATSGLRMWLHDLAYQLASEWHSSFRELLRPRCSDQNPFSTFSRARAGCYGCGLEGVPAGSVSCVRRSVGREQFYRSGQG